MLIHANRRWPEAITPNPWPYALRTANSIHNETLSLKFRQSPLERFTGTQVLPSSKYWHPFGAPAHVLDSDVVSGKKFPRWTDQVRVGVYLGPSPQHARPVALVLSLTTGLASPKFHVTIDDSFQTMRNALNTAHPKLLWQVKSKFIQGNTQDTPQQGMRTQTHPAEGDPQRTSSESGLSCDDLSNQVQRIPAVPPPQLDIQQRPTEVQESAEDLRQLPQDPALQDTLTQQPEPDTYGLRGSQRAALPPQRLIEGLEAQVRQESTTHAAYETLYKPDMGTELEDQDPLLAFAASADPDTMDLHEAMKQPDKDQLKQAVKEEPLFYLQCDR